MRLLAKAFLGSIASFAFGIPPGQGEDQPQDVEIRVEPGSVIAAIPDDFIGFGYETSAVAHEGLFTPGNSKLVQLYRNLSPHGLVRIGGIISDHAAFIPGGVRKEASLRGTTVINTAALFDLAGFLRLTGWKAMWGLNLGTGSKEEAAEEAVAIANALGDQLHSFEIGNEVDAFPIFSQGRGFDGYYASYREYKDAIRTALPAAAFSGPDVASNTTWCAEFARREGPDCRALTHHYYRAGASEPEATVETLLEPDLRLKAVLQKLGQAGRGRRIAYRINEVNSFYGGGKPGVSDTFASALWCLDFMFLAAAHGCGGVNIETDVNQKGWVSSYSPIFRDETDHLIARPSYYGMLAFALAGKGDLLRESLGKGEVNLTAYATQDGQRTIWITIINKDLHRDAHVRISGAGLGETGELMRLNAPSLESRDHVTLAGMSVSDDGTWRPGPSEKLSFESGAFDVDVPRASAALLRSPPAR
jgi:hypothetical protein